MGSAGSLMMTELQQQNLVATAFRINTVVTTFDTHIVRIQAHSQAIPTTGISSLSVCKYGGGGLGDLVTCDDVR